MLIFDGYKSYINAELDDYYKAVNIIPLFLLAYSLYLSHPLEISIFSLLKRGYSVRISFFA